MRGLKDKAIIVAGGATGIGAATAKRIAQEGARVVVGDINGAGANHTAEQINLAGGTAYDFEFDISEEDSCRALVQETQLRCGAVDGLYNVAADLSADNLGRDTDVVSLPIEVLKHTLEVNLIGYFYTCRPDRPFPASDLRAHAAATPPSPGMDVGDPQERLRGSLVGVLERGGTEFIANDAIVLAVQGHIPCLPLVHFLRLHHVQAPGRLQASDLGDDLTRAFPDESDRSADHCLRGRRSGVANVMSSFN